MTFPALSLISTVTSEPFVTDPSKIGFDVVILSPSGLIISTVGASTNTIFLDALNAKFSSSGMPPYSIT